VLVYVLSPMRSALGIAHTDVVSYKARIASPRRLSRVFVYKKRVKLLFGWQIVHRSVEQKVDACCLRSRLSFESSN